MNWDFFIGLVIGFVAGVVFMAVCTGSVLYSSNLDKRTEIE